jgi:putative N6-adenine-specific DNA methylase
MSRTILVTCPRGLVDTLRDEIAALGLPITSAQRASVVTEGTLIDCLRLNLALRTALHVLYELDEFACRSPEDLYRHTATLPWEDIIAPDGYVSVTSRVDHETVNNSMFPSLKVKDAIVDRIAAKHGRRPDAGPKTTGVVVSLYWRGDRARLYLNTSGAKLADRSYRKMPHRAPMQETLAAAVVMATGYDGTIPFINPMCGSGTLAIEAALIAQGRPPGALRPMLSLMNVIGFDKNEWNRVRKSMQAATNRSVPPIIVSDHDETALDATRQNACTAGVEQLLTFQHCDFADTVIPDEPGIVILNPEYGHRMGDVNALREVYARIGDFFKQRCPGSMAFIFTGNRELAKHVGLRAEARTPFFSADLDCRLLRYRMFEGKLDDTPSSPSSSPSSSQSSQSMNP